jgi:hypothetical protein
MVFLDCNQAAEAPSQHKYRPQPQDAAEHKDHQASPAKGLAVDRPKIAAVRIGGKIREENGKRTDGCNHPSVATILVLARAQVAFAKKRNHGYDERRNRKCEEWGMGEERRETAPAKDGKPELHQDADEGCDHGSHAGGLKSPFGCSRRAEQS